MNQTTANTPAPKTRSEAWLAWEAAILSKMGKEWLARQRPHLKAFNREMNGRMKWWLFAHGTLPNSGIVILRRLNGEEDRINIMRPYLRDLIKNLVSTYRVSPDYPELQERQKELLAENRESYRYGDLVGYAPPTKSTHLRDSGGHYLFRQFRLEIAGMLDVNRIRLHESGLKFVDPDDHCSLIEVCPILGVEFFTLATKEALQDRRNLVHGFARDHLHDFHRKVK